MAETSATHFPGHLQRQILKELDIRFWIIFFCCFVCINSFFYYRVVNPIVLSAADKQAFIRKLYKVDKTVIANLEAQKQAAVVQQQREEKKEEVQEKREERKKMTDAERAQARKQAKAQREAKKAERRMRAAKKFVAAGVARAGSGGLGRSGRKGRGAGGKSFGISGTGSRGIVSGGLSSLGGGPRFVEGEAYVEDAGDIDITATESVEMTEGELTGGVIIEEIEEPTGTGAASVNRSSDALMMVIEPQLGSLQRCYERYRKKDPQLNGRVVIKFTINADGSVSRITITGRWSNPQLGAQVEDCIRNRIERRWRFDPIQEGDTQVEVPISFK